MIISLGLMLACSTPEPVPSLPYYDSEEFTPRWLEQAPDADFHAVPDFALTDQHGAVFTRADMHGKVAIVDFFFASCTGICPSLSKSMLRADQSLPADAPLVLLSHSVTPEADTVEVLAGFAEKHHITSSRWHLLTGDRSLIYKLGREVYFVEEDEGEASAEGDFLHTESIVLVDQEGHIRGVYNGLKRGSVDQLIGDARTLLAQAP